MSFILNNQNAAPVADPSGKINLVDWKHNITTPLSEKRNVQVPSTGEYMIIPMYADSITDAQAALSVDDLHAIAGQGYFPNIEALLFLRGETHEVDAIIPMLSRGTFFDKYADEVKQIVEMNLRKKTTQAAWVEYYTDVLHNFPIFKTIFNLLGDKNKALIGQQYFQEFHDVKYLNQTQIDKLSDDERIKYLTTIVSRYRGNDGKLDVALSLFASQETIEPEQFVAILGLFTDSATVGRLFNVPVLVKDKTNAHNLIAVWIRLCLQENMGVNQSVWYNRAVEVELQHGLAITAPYTRQVPNQPIGGLQTTSNLGQVSGAFQSSFSANKPIGM